MKMFLKEIHKRIFFLLFIGIFCITDSFAQSVNAGGEVPDHFGEIYLGMTMDQVKKALKSDPNFNFTGDPDISILKRPDETLIECSGTYFISRGIFQFYKDKLYTIILSLDTDELDHYGMFTTLSGKYGSPESLSPQEAVWKSKKYILVLERPLSVKYMDRQVLDTIRTAGRTEKTLHELSREQFMQQF